MFVFVTSNRSLKENQWDRSKMTEFLSLNELLLERQDMLKQYNAICCIGKCWKALWDCVSYDARAPGQAEKLAKKCLRWPLRNIHLLITPQSSWEWSFSVCLEQPLVIAVHLLWVTWMCFCDLLDFTKYILNVIGCYWMSALSFTANIE